MNDSGGRDGSSSLFLIEMKTLTKGDVVDDTKKLAQISRLSNLPEKLL